MSHVAGAGPRRTPVVPPAAAALAAALLACAPASAGAQAPAAAPAAGPAAAAPPRRHVVDVGGHPVTVWATVPARAPRGALLLVHGRRWSARPNFDLRAAGIDRSVMAALARRGYAAYAVDLRGYGATPRDTTGWLTPERAAADVGAVLAWLAGRQPAGAARPALVGYSRGAAVAMLAAQRRPDALSALVLFGFPYHPDSLPRPGAPDPAAPPRAPNTAEQAASDFVTPGAQPRAVVDAYVRAALAADPVTADWRALHEFAALDPARVTVPTLVLDGARDPLAGAAGRGRLVPRLGTEDRWWVTLPASDHAAHVEDAHAAWVDAVADFVERPRR